MSDIIIGLQYGDEGKGKITKAFIEEGDYTHCVRFNGGPNAGHTIYFNGNKLVTHQVPTGIVHGLRCIIGPCCVVDIEKLEGEIKMLEDAGVVDVRKNLKVAYNAHIIFQKHIDDDINNDVAGSTQCGIRPVYRDKYNRCGTRAEKYENICGCEIVDSYKELSEENVKVLFEGAQGFMLDIDWGHYPYVTSSHCTSGMITSCGFPFQRVGEVVGVAKIYETYVGNMKFGPEGDADLERLGVLGEEYGATTGRRRQCNWLNLDRLNKALAINSVTQLVINKCDIIEKLGVYKLYHGEQLIEFDNLKDMQDYVLNNVRLAVEKNNSKIVFSASKDSI